MVQKDSVEKRGEKLKVIYFFPVLLAIFLGVVFSYFVLSGTQGITGNVVLDMDTIHQDGEIIGGKLNVLLEEGEFIPASSVISFETMNQTYDYVLSDIINSDPIEGDFYLKENSLSGNGEGYGLSGSKKIYPEVIFKLALYSEDVQEPSSSGEEDLISEEQNNQVEEQELNDSGESIEDSNASEDVVTNLEEPVTEEIVGEGNNSPKESEVSTEASISDEEEVTVDEEPIVDSDKEEVIIESEQESSQEVVSEEDSESTASEIVSAALESVADFFLGLTMTGNIVLDSEFNEKVSADKPFVYELTEGQTAKIVSSSQNVKLKMEGNKVIVTTDYFEEETGFGEDYSGDQKMNLLIDLKKLDFPLDENIEVKINYDGKDIKTFSIVSEQENLLEEEEVELNQTILENNTIVVKEKREVLLTDDEKKLLTDKFGDISLKVTEAKQVENGIEVKFEFGDYATTRFYDSDFSKQALEAQIKEDRINWLKDIANSFYDEESNSEDLTDLIADYSLDE